MLHAMKRQTTDDRDEPNGYDESPRESSVGADSPQGRSMPHDRGDEEFDRPPHRSSSGSGEKWLIILDDLGGGVAILRRRRGGRQSDGKRTAHASLVDPSPSSD